MSKNPQGEDEIVIQGDVGDEIVDMIRAQVKELKGAPVDQIVRVSTYCFTVISCVEGRRAECQGRGEEKEGTRADPLIPVSPVADFRDAPSVNINIRIVSVKCICYASILTERHDCMTVCLGRPSRRHRPVITSLCVAILLFGYDLEELDLRILLISALQMRNSSIGRLKRDSPYSTNSRRLAQRSPVRDSG